MSSTQIAPRRIAVVLDGPGTPRWQQAALVGLADSELLEVVEVRLVGPPRGRGRLSRAHAAIERRLFAAGPDALTPVRLYPSAFTVGDGEGREADLVVWLAERPLPDGESRDVLHLRHGRRHEPAEDAFRRALLRGLPCVETEALLKGTGGTVVVERTVSGARPFSTTLSRDKALWKIAVLIRRAAERAPGLGAPASPAQPAGRTPSRAELLVRSPWRWIRIVSARLLFLRPWQLLVRERGLDPSSGWRGLTSIVSGRRGHLYADPFLFEHEGSHHLFCEELSPRSWRAVISHVELSPDGSLAGPPVPVLEAQYHLSYPFVFAHEGEVFLIPETSAQQRVELYQAVEFPGTWRRVAVLLEGMIASDATLLEHAGRLWLFVGVAAPNATMLDEMHLFSALSLRGPWLAHPLNPVVSDVGCARPAGAIQRWGGRLVRPGQDGSRRYGGAVSFREIDELSVERYSEHEVARLEPGELGARATHTYTADGRFEAIDLRRRQPRLALPVPKLLRGRSKR